MLVIEGSTSFLFGGKGLHRSGTSPKRAFLIYGEQSSDRLGLPEVLYFPGTHSADASRNRTMALLIDVLFANLAECFGARLPPWILGGASFSEDIV